MVKLAFFDSEHVEREAPERPWRALVLSALAATGVLTAGYELFWRAKGLAAGDYNNTSALWAEARRSVKPQSTVIIGSSRIFFGADLGVWETLTGKRPVQLALEGTSPRIFLKNLAEDESFKGLVVVGVTTPLFFMTDGGLRAESLKYARDETPAQRADHVMTKKLESVLAFIDEQSRPKRQVAIWPFPLREGMTPRFDPRKLASLGPDRDARLWNRVLTDERYRKEAIDMWALGIRNNTPPRGLDGRPRQMPDEAINAVIAEVKSNADKIRARGGDVAFVRMPYGGVYTSVEDFGFPRARFWDRLVSETNSVGVSWQDHAALQSYELPEDSHLSASEATRFTRALVPILYSELEKRRAPGG
ncbi:MAG: hypothetical protein ACK4NP_08335 [Parvularculaceae bacterium]